MILTINLDSPTNDCNGWSSSGVTIFGRNSSPKQESLGLKLECISDDLSGGHARVREPFAGSCSRRPCFSESQSHFDNLPSPTTRDKVFFVQRGCTFALHQLQSHHAGYVDATSATASFKSCFISTTWIVSHFLVFITIPDLPVLGLEQKISHLYRLLFSTEFL